MDPRDLREGFRGRIEFTYIPREHESRSWINIVSLKKNDREAPFVFRFNAARRYFQVFFGDGKSTRGEAKIGAIEFAGKHCVLDYTRTRDFTFLTLTSEHVKEMRFVQHIGSIADATGKMDYEEGRPEDGFALHRNEFTKLVGGEVELSAIEEELVGVAGGRQGSNTYSNSLNALGSVYFSKGNYQRSLATLRVAYHLRPSAMSFEAFAKARGCINNLYEGDGRAEAWRNFSSPADHAFGKARRLVLSGDFEASTRSFNEAVDDVLGGPPYVHDAGMREKLRTAYLMLVAGTKGIAPKQTPHVEPVRKIIVSGLGWSGSGAIYDYLREFPGVVAIDGESPYIEGTESLRTIWSSLDDERKLRRRLTDFFFYALVGHGYLRNGGDFKLAKEARTKLASPDGDSYLDLIVGWCAIASAICAADPVARLSRFPQLADYTINHFCIGRDIAADQVVLLDNAVHIANSAECIPFLSHTNLLCSFRDPRSNYVALVRESSHFNASPEAYIKTRKKHLANSTAAAKSAVGLAQSYDDRAVEMVQFEEFVLSESFRVALAKRLRLRLDGQNKFTHFKPWESMRNVTLHVEHPRQEEIRLIEKELGEYCCEPGVRPLHDLPHQLEKL